MKTHQGLIAGRFCRIAHLARLERGRLRRIAEAATTDIDRAFAEREHWDACLAVSRADLELSDARMAWLKLAPVVDAEAFAKLQAQRAYEEAGLAHAEKQFGEWVAECRRLVLVASASARDAACIG